MRPGYDERLAPSQKLMMYQRCKRGEWNALVEHIFQLNIAAGNCVSDDDKVGMRLQVLFRERLRDRNPQAAQQVGHRRIGRLVGAGDAMSFELQQPGKRSHGCAADSDEMNVFALHLLTIVT